MKIFNLRDTSRQAVYAKIRNITGYLPREGEDVPLEKVVEARGLKLCGDHIEAPDDFVPNYVGDVYYLSTIMFQFGCPIPLLSDSLSAVYRVDIQTQDKDDVESLANRYGFHIYITDNCYLLQSDILYSKKLFFDTRENIIFCLKINGNLIQCVQDQDEELCNIALDQNLHSFIYIRNPSDAIVDRVRNTPLGDYIMNLKRDDRLLVYPRMRLGWSLI